MAPTMPPVMAAITVDADISVRICQVPGGTSGAGTWRSMSQNAVSSMVDAADPTMVWVEAHPWVPAFSMA